MYLSTQHHLTYCTNIHPGAHWHEVMQALDNFIPPTRQAVSPEQPFGIGLRLSHLASEALLHKDRLEKFRAWLERHHCYVFTINGFPYGGFHHQVVKASVHEPDWTRPERLHYTLRLLHILAKLLPEGMEGSVSTSPLSYRLWHSDAPSLRLVYEQATQQLAQIAAHLYKLYQDTGKVLHVDLEPEPDGLLENAQDVTHYFHEWLLPLGTKYLQNQLGLSSQEADHAIRQHIQVCYDICHFAVVYADPQEVFAAWQAAGIRIGKIQISSALKAELPPDPGNRSPIIDALTGLVEPTYLHQVVARTEEGALVHYADLPEALPHMQDSNMRDCRIHFHVPIFLPAYGILSATQEDIIRVLAMIQQVPSTQHLEVETYTWEVLPITIRTALGASIIRELRWVQDKLTSYA